MKTITALLIGGSLALAGAVYAQETSPQESPAKKGGKGQKAEQAETTRGGGGNATGNAQGNAKANRSAVSAEASTSATETGGGKQRGGKHAKTEMGASATGAESSTGANAGANTNVNATTETGGKKGKHGRNATVNTSAEAGASVPPTGSQSMETGGKKGKGRNATVNTSAETGASVSPGASMPMDQGGKKGRKAARAAAAASASAAPSASVGTNATSATSTTNATTSATPATSATVGAAAATTNTTTATTATGGNPPAGTLTKEQGTVGRGGKKVEVQQLQQIKQQHATFRAQPRPDRVPAVTFTQNYRISGAERWQGPQYEVYRSYHPEWHDQSFYRSRYQRVELVGGGYYYWNNGYWYPAWGYDPGNSYYAYDAPIYVGHRAEPPDRVIADVQAELQQMGYYTGEVDGLLGPLTRQALRDYQAEHGLMVTEVIDEPTLDALQLS